MPQFLIFLGGYGSSKDRWLHMISVDNTVEGITVSCNKDNHGFYYLNIRRHGEEKPWTYFLCEEARQDVLRQLETFKIKAGEETKKQSKLIKLEGDKNDK